MTQLRLDGRSPDAIRPLHFTRRWLPTRPGSVLVDCGLTRVLCTAVIEDGVPKFLKGTDQGWVTAEYSMLPAATNSRRPRERGPRVDGRSVEIQRLIGRALRAVVNRKALRGRTVWVDCDVLSADGGTRTASINGAYVALHDALKHLQESGNLKSWPLTDSLQAISVGLLDGAPHVDLSYYEDSSAEVDMNLIVTGSGKVVEMGGGAEQGAFSFEQLEALMTMGRGATASIKTIQEEALNS